MKSGNSSMNCILLKTVYESTMGRISVHDMINFLYR